MTSYSLPRRQLLQATERVAGGLISVSCLGQYVADATFLVENLAEANDPVASLIGPALETLEEIYAAALDRAWPELPSEEAVMACSAVAGIAQILSEVDQKS